MTTLITGETWGDNIEAARAYFLQQAQQSLGELRARLEAARQEFRAAFAQVSEAQAQYTPPVGEGEDAWGIAEVLRHIASIEPIMAERVRRLGSGESADGVTRTHPGYLAAVDSRRLADLRPLLERSYADLLAAIDAIDGHERLDTLAAHRRFGELNCRGWVALHTVHLQDHARQIERLQHQPGYPAA